MNERVVQELALLRSRYRDLEWLEVGQWVRIPRYGIPAGTWTISEVDAAFQIPESAGQAPYGFYVRPPLALVSGAVIQNYTLASTAFGGEWGKFSWSPAIWQPAADIHAGSNMLHFATSFAERLRQGA